MSLERLIRLAQKTGDKLIVHDPINERDVVLMSVDDYEALLSLREMQNTPQTLPYFPPRERKEEWQNHVIVPDVPLPPPMPRVVDPDEENGEDDRVPGEGMETDDAPPLPFELPSDIEEPSEDDDLFPEEREVEESREPRLVPIEPPVMPTQSASWHSVGGVARERFLSGDWLRQDREKEENETKEGKKGVEEEGDEPVFYEEPIG
jgi:hypothetical protein